MSRKAKPFRPPTVKTNRLSDQVLSSSYDAAQTTEDNRRHWARADGLSARAANNVMVRRLLRTRARYETDNNSYLTGIVRTLGHDTIGTGPRLQMLTGDKAIDSFIEERFTEWADEISLEEKLRVMREAGCISGESFAVFVTNPGINSDVKLDVELYEADQFTDPTWESDGSTQWCDGIRYDDYGNPASYRKLREHPGDLHWGANPLEFDDLPARNVYHFFTFTRPGQRRGIPEFASSLGNWPELRRYCDAVIAAAETAADHAMTIQTTLPADGDDEAPEAMDAVNLKKRMATVLPPGYTLGQTRAEQPTTTYPTFVNKKIAEACRCLSMPFTIAALDSAEANLSARYLDTAIYAKVIKTSRKKLERVLNRLLDLWLTEAIHIPGFLPALDRYPHKWYWPSVGEHADPDKVASGQGQRLKNGTSTLADECAEQGQDWEEVAQKGARSLGVTIDEYQALTRHAIYGAAYAPKAADAGNQANGPGPDPELERIKAEADAYSVGVRAGVITPQSDDESTFRDKMDLPAMSTDTQKAWTADGGIRRPVTLVQAGVAMPFGGAPAASEGEPTPEKKRGVIAALASWLGVKS